ncbi:hypothetical protein EG347_21345 [Chryseobacterium sp. G0186]|uniref:hypothetical protein n=1 Tax=Chryseobacterium sp. G0186 TaxID=2487064 RepID=UPI000F4D36E8|nr:hypothetical protein [Chryseobacterium sp. G0186]AZA79848.1 hypothetical protein EG347_21345 [Chryseobacterium sp. G0186]
MYKLIIGMCFLFLYSCGANKYSSLSKYNSFEREGDYYRFKNDSLNVTMLIFGGFDMAENKREFDSIKKGLHQPINKYKGDKLFYLQNSTYKTYDCALLVENKELPEQLKESKKIIIKTIQCGNFILSFKISKTTFDETVQFYFKDFKCLK